MRKKNIKHGLKLTFLINYQHTFFVIKSDERSGRGGEEEKIGEGKERPRQRRSRKGKKWRKKVIESCKNDRWKGK